MAGPTWRNSGDETCSDIVPDGVRNPDESDCVASYPARTSQVLQLRAVMKPSETRFARGMRRSREGEPTEFEHVREDGPRALGDGKSAFQANAFPIKEAHRRPKSPGGPGDPEDALAGLSQQCVASAGQEPSGSLLRGEPQAGKLADFQIWTRGGMRSRLSPLHARQRRKCVEAAWRENAASASSGLFARGLHFCAQPVRECEPASPRQVFQSSGVSRSCVARLPFSCTKATVSPFRMARPPSSPASLAN